MMRISLEILLDMVFTPGCIVKSQRKYLIQA